MPHRYTDPAADARPRLRLGSALRDRLSEGYHAADLRADLAAGLVVGIVALPLAMALAIASGVPPQHGLYTAIVAGAVIALLGGSRCNVSGPTAAFVVVLAPIAASLGLSGLLLATILAGLILLAMGALRMGRLIQFIPYPVTTGFTAGIAVVIATLQVPDAFGLRLAGRPEHYLDRVSAIVAALPGLRWHELAFAAGTLALLLLWPRITRRVPAPLVAMSLAGLAAWLVARNAPAFAVDTLGTRFSGIPRTGPAFLLPWTLPGPDGSVHALDLDLLRSLIGPALVIAMLGAIESLLCAVVADGMAGTRHDPDGELLAQGAGNLLAPLFGGIAATGAIARTATNVRAGARSPLAALFHALFVLAAVLLLAPLLDWLPMASLAALLLVVAWNMSELRHVAHILRVAPKSDTTVLLTCFLLTVVFDMVVAVSVGVVLAALLFMRRMAEIAQVQLEQGGSQGHPDVPHDVVIYTIAGPLFFGAAEKAVSALQRGPTRARAVILDLTGVPAMDVSGLVALESALDRLQRAGVLVVLAGARPQPARVLAKAGIIPRPGRLAVCDDMADAAALVRR
jgi:sulfate permease, SulP family